MPPKAGATSGRPTCYPGRWTKAAAADGGRSMSLDHARRTMKRMYADAPDPYDLRDSYASMMIKANQKSGMNSHAMDHAKISETYDRYEHEFDPEVSDLGAAMEQAMAGGLDDASEGPR